MKKLSIVLWAMALLFTSPLYAGTNPGEGTKDNPVQSADADGGNGSTDCPECQGDLCDVVKTNCLIYKIGFIVDPKLSETGRSTLKIYSEYPTPTLFTPQGLRFTSSLRNSKINRQATYGSNWEVRIRNVQGENISYIFKDGASVATPEGTYFLYDSRLERVDANGKPVTTTKDTVYYDRHFSNGALRRYSAATNEQLKMITAHGTVLTAASENVEIIKDEDGILRQIKSVKGLVDVVVTQPGIAYEIRIYPAGSAGTKNSDGFYQPSGDTLVTYVVENPTKDEAKINDVRFTKKLPNKEFVSNFTYQTASNQWTLVSANGQKQESKSIQTSDGFRTVTRLFRDSDGKVVYRKVDRFKIINKQINNKSFGQAHLLTESVTDPDGLARKTAYTYYEDTTETGRYCRPKTRLNPDGSWEAYDYDDQGRKTVVIRPYKNSPFNAKAALAQATYYSYEPVDSKDKSAFIDHRPRKITQKVKGITTSVRYYAYYTTATGEKVEVRETTTTPTAQYGDSSNHRTTTTYYGPTTGIASAGKVKSVQYYDNRLTSYSYQLGTYKADPTPVNSKFTVDSEGTAIRTTVINGTKTAPLGVANRTMKSVSVANQQGRNVLSESYLYTGDSTTPYERLSRQVNQFDAFGHVTRTFHSNGTETSATWSCCGIASQTAADGTKTTYAYDDLKRLITTTKKGYNGTADIVTEYTYDTMGNTLTTKVTAGSITLTTTNEYNTLNELTKTTDAAGLVTTYTQDTANRTNTTKYPSGVTSISTRNMDGSMRSTTGTAAAPRFYQSDINADGTSWSKVYDGIDNEAAIQSHTGVWSKSISDYQGRTIETETPTSIDGTTQVSKTFYNDLGRAIKSQTFTRTTNGDVIINNEVGAANLYVYESDPELRTLGIIKYSGQDINNDGSLTLASTDRISQSSSNYVKENGVWYNLSTSKTYATNGSATATELGISKSQITGLGTNGLIARSISTDINGNTAKSETFVDASTKMVTQKSDSPDSTVDSESVTVNGLLQTVKTKTGTIYTYSYDDLGRRIGTTDPRTGKSVVKYNTKGQVESVTDADNKQTKFTYDANTGRRTSVENALGKKSYTAYNAKGQVYRVWGDTTYPMEYTYDDFGRMISLKTFRAGQGWNQYTWPINIGTADETKWTYNQATGLLTAKKYADGHGSSYTYNTAGQLKTRTWARGTTTTYTYNQTTRALTGITYSDNTPAVGFTYDRLGRQTNVTDVQGNRTFAYNDKLQLAAETVNIGDTGVSKTITRKYDNLGRSAGFEFGDRKVAYGYDNYGRFNAVKTSALSVPSVVDTYQYSYVDNSNLIGSVTFPNGLVTTKTYETNRNLIDKVENKFNGTARSVYDFTNDAIGRRSDVAKSGTAFGTADKVTYNYNDRSEVTGATATNDTKYNFGYNFDNLGNRISSSTSESGSVATTNYSANALNQYTAVGTQAPTYDDDGNMTGTWLTQPDGNKADSDLYYNAENRLVKVIGNGQKLEFVYDYMGRRVNKKVYSGSETAWTLDKEVTFTYDGWNLIEEVEASVYDSGNSAFTQFRTSNYTWGLDLSQTLQGAGGVGGLLTMEKGVDKYNYTYDANGNVSELIDTAGNIAAHYEYSPFGKVVHKSGTMSGKNPFQFSTKYLDNETQLYYYGYRYYNPENGRWINRDPIREKGFEVFYGFKFLHVFWEDINNQYSFVDNEVDSSWDYIGLSQVDEQEQTKGKINTPTKAADKLAESSKKKSSKTKQKTTKKTSKSQWIVVLNYEEFHVPHCAGWEAAGEGSTDKGGTCEVLKDYFEKVYPRHSGGYGYPMPAAVGRRMGAQMCKALGLKGKTHVGYRTNTQIEYSAGPPPKWKFCYKLKDRITCNCGGDKNKRGGDNEKTEYPKKKKWRCITIDNKGNKV